MGVWDRNGCVGWEWVCGIGMGVWDRNGCVGEEWL